MKTSNAFIARQCDQAGEVVEMGRSAEQAASAMPDCWVVVKNGRILGTHDEPAHIDGLNAVRYVPAIAQPVSKYGDHDLQALILQKLAQPTTPAQAAQPTDAERYQWLRAQDWFDGELCVLREPKKVLTRGKGLGADCPSRDRLDTFIDAAIAASKGAA